MSGQGHENEIGDIRYAFIYEGPIVDNVDPLKLGRVKVRIPGLCEPSTAWALPAGTQNGGTKQRGQKMTPPIGAEVAVYFKGGDPDQPRFMGGHWGTGEMPTDAADPSIAAADVPKVHTHEFERYKITVDERDGSNSFSITDKTSGDTITHDGGSNGPGWYIKGSAAVVIECDGMVVIDAASCVINDRKVTDGSQPI